MTTYREAGVDSQAADELVDRIAPLAKRTARPEVIAGVGGFAGLFALPPGKYREPVLVSGADGVGTKLRLAFQLQRHRTVGIDLVAMNVNDILTCGAEPLFFLDYFATSKLEVAQAEAVVAGVAEGCLRARCTLLGGETAEVPGFYARGEYELAGFAVGAVERSDIIDGRGIAPGSSIIGLASTGFHSNGYSLVRRVLEQAKVPLDTIVEGEKLADALLEPTFIYVDDVLALLKFVRPLGMAHITGSGIPGNLPRCFPPGLVARVDTASWKRPWVFDFLATTGAIARQEMFDTFNMGLGFMMVLRPQDVTSTLAHFRSRSLKAWEVGVVEAGEPGQPTHVELA